MARTFSHYFTKMIVRGRILDPVSLNTVDSSKETQTKELEDDDLEKFNLEIDETEYAEDADPNPEPGPDPGPDPGPAPGPGPGPPIIDVVGKITRISYYVGIRLDDLLYQDAAFRKKIGLKMRGEITTRDNRLSRRFMRSFPAAVAFGAFKVFTVAFIPVDPARTDEAWGNRKIGTIVTSAILSREEVDNALLEAKFPIGQTGAIYSIESDSIRPKNSRKSAEVL